ncbi:MAG: carbohydrate binding domain-containing protein [Candidatus Hodarchaeales archaeon]
MDILNKRKNRFISFLVIILLLSVFSSGANKTNAVNIQNTNLLSNSSFEYGESLPSSWITDSWIPDVDFVWDYTHSYMGVKSVKISTTTANDARWIQEVTVQPNTDYRLSGWIKTENVAHTSGLVDAGANLSIYGTWDHTTAMFGTNAWTMVSMTFNSGSSSNLIIAARLGYWSGITTGTAWFDNLTLEPLNPTPTPHTVFLPIVIHTEYLENTGISIRDN